MIFSVLVLVLVLGVTYMHYLQGAFTAAISLACALAAALVAFGYYETLVNMTSAGGFSDFAGGAALIVLFTITYGVLRVIADMLVPGNIQLQLYVEKAGAAVFGFLAALIAGGTFATGVQLMPLGGSVAGFSRYELQGRDVVVTAAMSGKPRGADTTVNDEVVKPEYDGNPSSLLLPADNFVLSLVKTASAGSFSGTQSFAALHPDLTTEAFGARVGAEISAKHVILNTAKQTNVTLGGLFVLKTTPKAYDTEVVDLRPQKTSLTYKPSTRRHPGRRPPDVRTRRGRQGRVRPPHARGVPTGRKRPDVLPDGYHGNGFDDRLEPHRRRNHRARHPNARRRSRLRVAEGRGRYAFQTRRRRRRSVHRSQVVRPDRSVEADDRSVHGVERSRRRTQAGQPARRANETDQTLTAGPSSFADAERRENAAEYVVRRHPADHPAEGVDGPP